MKKLFTQIIIFCMVGKSTSAANAASNICPFTGAFFGSPQAGKITVANSEQNQTMSETLTNYIVGCPSDDLEKQLDLLVPANETERMFQFWKLEGGDFLTEVKDDDIRAVDSAFKRVSRAKGTKELGQTHNKGLTMRIDLDARLYTDGHGSLRAGALEEVATSLRKRLVRAELIRFYALLDAAAGNGTNKTWNNAGNPDADLRALIEAGRLACGSRADRVVFASDAWTLRADSYEANGRNDTMAARAGWDLTKLAQHLMVKNVVMDELLYQTTQADPKKRGIASRVYTYLSSDGLTPMDASNVKRFYSTTKQGGKWAVYVDDKDKYVDITVEHYSTFIAPMTAGIGKLIVSA